MADHGEKECRACGDLRPLAEYRTNSHTRKDGTRHTYPRPLCRSCDNADQRGRYDAAGQRNRSLIRRYGMTEQDFQDRLVLQGGCAACGSETTDGKYWHVDHDHSCCDTQASSCGRCVRGILCHGCNTALGNVKDSPARLLQLIQYLVRSDVVV